MAAIGTVKTLVYLQVLKFSDGTSVEVWLDEARFDTWGREPGKNYALTKHNEDGSLTYLWKVSHNGILVLSHRS